MDRFRLMPNYRYYNIEGASPLTLDRSVGKPLRNYKIYGNSVQDGTPTPETPVEIQSIGDKSRNLFDIADFAIADNYTSGKVPDGVIVEGNSITIANLASVSISLKKSKLWQHLKPNTRYTINYKQTIVDGTTSSTTGYIALLPLGTAASYNFCFTGVPKTTTSPEDLSEFNYLTIYGGKNCTVTFSDIVIREYDGLNEYEPYGYKIPITVSGKNLFDFTSAIDDSNWSTDISYKRFLPFVFKKGIHYTISMSDNLCQKNKYPWAGTNTQVAMVVNSENKYGGKTIGHSNLITASNIIDIYNETEDTYLVMYATPGLSKKDIFETLFPNFQIEVGESATEYEPYKEPQTHNIYLDEPLYKIGDYADYIDFINHKVIRKNKRATVYLTKLTVYNTISENLRTYVASGMFTDCNNANAYNVTHKCNKFKYNNGGNLKPAESVGEWLAMRGNGAIYITIKTERLSEVTMEAAAEYINSLNAELVYQLAEPIEEDISLPTIKTHKGTNIITVGTDVPVSNIAVQYYK